MDEERTIAVRFEAKDLSFDQIVDALSKFRSVLEQASRAVLRDTGISSAWRVRTMSYNSPLTLVAAPDLPKREVRYASPIVRRVRNLIAGTQKQSLLRERTAIENLRAVLDGQIRSLVVSSEAGDATLRPRPAAGGRKESPTLPGLSTLPVTGTVTGRAQVLDVRKDLLFQLIDLHSREAIFCYLADDQREWLDGLLDQIVEVDGDVSRDPASGRPKSIRNITRIEERPPLGAGALDRIPGLLKDKLDVESDEAVRWVRNG